MLIQIIGKEQPYGISYRIGFVAFYPFLDVFIGFFGALIGAGIGIGVSFAGVWSFRKARTTVNPLEPSQATHFVSKGVYQLSRNPMYVGLACCLLAWAIWLSYLLTWIGIPLFIAYMTRFQIIPEERALRLKFGKEYENYCLKVRRWL